MWSKVQEILVRIAFWQPSGLGAGRTLSFNQAYIGYEGVT